jgi:hypothetical protein
MRSNESSTDDEIYGKNSWRMTNPNKSQIFVDVE